MKILCLSDTHNFLPNLSIYEQMNIDTIIHCGDFTENGTKEEVFSFLEWFKNLKFKNKIFIAGNHDFYCQTNELDINNYCISNNLKYLRDSSISIDGINFWGTPYVINCHGWAFNKEFDIINNYWKLISNNTHVLITHIPPAKVTSLSKSIDNIDLGCPKLKKRVNIIKPLYHIFGHIHEGHGTYNHTDIYYINCCIQYNSKIKTSNDRKNHPFIFNVSLDQK